MGSLLALLKELGVALVAALASLLKSRRERESLELPAAVAGGIHRCPLCGHRCTYCKRALTQSSDPPREAS